MKYDTGLDLKKITGDIESYLAKQNIIGKVVDIVTGPMVSTFYFEPESEFNLPKKFNIGDLILYFSDIVYIYGVRYAQIEVHNMNRQMTWLKPLMPTDKLKNYYKTPIVIGINTSGDPIYCNLGFNNSILITGDPGRGKSTFIDSVKKVISKDIKLPQGNKGSPRDLIAEINDSSDYVFFIDGGTGYLNEDSSAVINAMKQAIKRNVVFIVAVDDDNNLPDEFVNLFPNRLIFKSVSDKYTDFLLPYGDAVFFEYGYPKIRVHTPYDNE